MIDFHWRFLQDIQFLNFPSFSITFVFLILDSHTMFSFSSSLLFFSMQAAISILVLISQLLSWVVWLWHVHWCIWKLSVVIFTIYFIFKFILSQLKLKIHFKVIFNIFICFLKFFLIIFISLKFFKVNVNYHRDYANYTVFFYWLQSFCWWFKMPAMLFAAYSKQLILCLKQLWPYSSCGRCWSGVSCIFSSKSS